MNIIYRHESFVARVCLTSRFYRILAGSVYKNHFYQISNILVRNYFFLKNYFTSEGAVTHNVLYYQQLSIARYQVRFYANNCLDYYQ